MLGLRQLCNEKKLLLLMDGVQDGHFRTGRFQSFQRLFENDGNGFLPDGISMAKALGNGFPIGAFWVRAPYADLLGAGTHGTTYGGSPLACAVALKVLEVIEREHLADNARRQGEFLKAGLEQLAGSYPSVIRTVRGLGLMIGIELSPDIAKLPLPSLRVASINSELLREIRSVRKTGFTRAPEAGSERLRKVINKDFS